MSGDDNIINFPSLREMAETGGPVSRVRRSWGDGCRHDHGVLVDDVDRVVTCKRCQKPIDAFDALERLAVAWDWEHTREARKRAQEEAAKLSAHIDRLKSVRVRERRKGYVEAEAVRCKFADVVRMLRERGGPPGGGSDERLAAHLIETALRDLLDEA